MSVSLALPLKSPKPATVQFKPTAPKEVADAYRKLAIKFHPDKNPGDEEAIAKFKEAAEAFEVLHDGDKRARYDRYGHAGVEAGAALVVTMPLATLLAPVGAGDVVGVYDPGIFEIGDTLTAGKKFLYEDIPSFAPEHFARVLMIITTSSPRSIAPCNQYNETIPGRILTQAQSRRSTSVRPARSASTIDG